MIDTTQQKAAVRRRVTSLSALAIAALLAACSGGSGDGSSTASGGANPASAGGQPAAATVNGSVDAYGNPVSSDVSVAAVANANPDVPTTKSDAVRFLEQSGFGPNETTVAETMQRGPRKQLLIQFDEPASRYTYTLPAAQYRDQIHSAARQDFCAQFASETPERDNCWRDWYSTQPMAWDFFRQATANRDQLRQRVALALSQIFVISGIELDGTYGFAEYHQMLRDNAFGNFRTLVQKVTLSPMMGRYLNMVDNEGTDPNENYGRELLQLFTVGTCLLNPDGTMAGGKCTPTYDNTIVRNYAYALSGWTYPRGGINPWCTNCNSWKNPRFLRGDMVAVAARHDSAERQLLSGIKKAAGSTPQQSLNAVLDSILAHPNVGPFIGKQLIQQLVTSNPTPAYVARVASAFDSGSYSDARGTIGSGQKGDMKATLAAVLLDSEARDPSAAAAAGYGRLKEPIQYIAAAIRALNGSTDGANFGGWGEAADMGQAPFNPPSVFNWFPPDYPLPKTTMVAPQFAIANTNTSLARINFANSLVYWWYNKGQGLVPDSSIPNATGTRVGYTAWENLISDTTKDSMPVVDRLNDLLTAGRLTAAEKAAIVTAMDSWKSTDTWLTDANNQSNWKRERVKTAAYLILSSPQYQVQR
ncbi:MAG TPA: DUF1800 domain-containing protein [Burkholderiaceae bacterium]|nr:DUF1800 domain-containing protein [Burkholderiaceae bacterium]